MADKHQVLYCFTGNDVMQFEEDQRKIYFLAITEGLQTGGAEWVTKCVYRWQGVQIIEVIEKYFRDHPERWDEAAPVLVKDALREACSQ